MKIKPTEDFLNIFDYNYTTKGSTIIVELDYGYHVFIDFSNPEKVRISDKLIGLNFLTGFISMKVKTAVLLNFLCMGLISYVMNINDYQTGMISFFCLSLWPMGWGLYFLTKSEHLKKFMISWVS